MIIRELTTDLSPSGFESLSKQIKALSKDIDTLNHRFLNVSMNYLRGHAVSHIQISTGKGGYPLTYELISSFDHEIEGNVGKLINFAYHSAVVEFGSGIVGKKAPHEWAAELGITYDANLHGEAGWTYMGDDGNYYHTTGMEAHRYMYNALMDYLYGGGKELCMKTAMESLR